MSQGLVCIDCRKYVAQSADRENQWTCTCASPRPSWDFKRPARVETLTPYVLERMSSEGDEADGE